MIVQDKNGDRIELEIHYGRSYEDTEIVGAFYVETGDRVDIDELENLVAHLESQLHEDWATKGS